MLAIQPRTVLGADTSDRGCDEAPPCIRECEGGRAICKHKFWPAGDLVPRMPYETFRTYYYDRPYNHQHLQASGISDLIPEQESKTRFTNVYEEIERQALAERTNALRLRGSEQDVLTRDKVLEYVDWRAYQRARSEWEADISAKARKGNEIE